VRSGSLTSLNSLSSLSGVSISGYILLSVEWDSSNGEIVVKMLEGAAISPSDGLYIKTYLSHDGQDIKSSKQKTKPKVIPPPTPLPPSLSFAKAGSAWLGVFSHDQAAVLPVLSSDH
jgi:hypothetical protein